METKYISSKEYQKFENAYNKFKDKEYFYRSCHYIPDRVYFLLELIGFKIFYKKFSELETLDSLENKINNYSRLLSVLYEKISKDNNMANLIYVKDGYIKIGYYEIKQTELTDPNSNSINSINSPYELILTKLQSLSEIPYFIGVDLNNNFKESDYGKFKVYYKKALQLQASLTKSSIFKDITVEDLLIDGYLNSSTIARSLMSSKLIILHIYALTGIKLTEHDLKLLKSYTYARKHRIVSEPKYIYSFYKIKEECTNIKAHIEFKEDFHNIKHIEKEYGKFKNYQNNSFLDSKIFFQYNSQIRVPFEKCMEEDMEYVRFFNKIKDLIIARDIVENRMEYILYNQQNIELLKSYKIKTIEDIEKELSQ